MTERSPYPVPPRLFDSFWVAGFESNCSINSLGIRLDLLSSTQHDQQVAADYLLMRSMGISTVRDGVRWHLIEQAGKFDFSSLVPMIEAAQQHGIQVIWDLLHWGWPEDVDVFAPAFADRFARFCGATARFISEHSGAVPVYTPINEISYLTWAAGERGLIYPYGQRRGDELKRQLVRATIAAIETIWDIDPRARIVSAEPLDHIVPPRIKANAVEAAAIGLTKTAALRHALSFEAWDMLAGYACPELGGHPRYLDGNIGVTYYYENQREYPPDQRLLWDENEQDERWMPLHKLLIELFKRYGLPVFIAETGHFGKGRGPWLREVAAEVCQARALGVPVEGICIYPILDRHDFTNLDHWHNSGLWDLVPDGEGNLQRVLNTEYAQEVQYAQAILAQQGCS